MDSRELPEDQRLDSSNLDGGGVDKPDPAKVFDIHIDRVLYKLTDNRVTGAELRQVPNPPIPPERDIFEIVPDHQDRKVENEDRILIKDGLRFFTAPNTINPGTSALSH